MSDCLADPIVHNHKDITLEKSKTSSKEIIKIKEKEIKDMSHRKRNEKKWLKKEFPKDLRSDLRYDFIKTTYDITLDSH